jgi:general stress protein 26
MSNMIKQEEMETLRELIKEVDTAMLTTVTEEGLVSRPMKTQEVEFSRKKRLVNMKKFCMIKM